MRRNNTFQMEIRLFGMKNKAEAFFLLYFEMHGGNPDKAEGSGRNGEVFRGMGAAVQRLQCNNAAPMTSSGSPLTVCSCVSYSGCTSLTLF